MIKRTLMMLVTVSLFVFLIGCKDEKVMNEDLGLEQTGKIEVLSGDDPKSVMNVIDKQADIDDFVNQLQLDAWKIADGAPNIVQENMFKMFQKDTVKLGESKEDKQDFEEIASIISYKDIPIIELRTKDLTLHFEIPNEVAEFLANKIN